MEVIKASVLQQEEKVFIKIEAKDEEIRIPISADKPNEVKAAFNQIIKCLKNGEFQIQLKDVGDDLFSQVAKEYIAQLNREIKEVYSEMKRYGLV